MPVDLGGARGLPWFNAPPIGGGRAAGNVYDQRQMDGPSGVRFGGPRRPQVSVGPSVINSSAFIGQIATVPAVGRIPSPAPTRPILAPTPKPPAPISTPRPELVVPPDPIIDFTLPPEGERPPWWGEWGPDKPWNQQPPVVPVITAPPILPKPKGNDMSLDLGQLLVQVATGYVNQQWGSGQPVVGPLQNYGPTNIVGTTPAVDIPYIDVIPQNPGAGFCGNGGGYFFDPAGNCGQGKWLKRRKKRRKRLATASDIKDLASLSSVTTPSEKKTWIATHPS